MKEFKKLLDGMNFTLKSYNKKIFSRFNKETNKFETSPTWIKGYQPKYIFEAEDCMLSLSKDQLGQILVGCFEEKNDWKDTKFYVKTNGKTGLEVRYYINVSKQDDYSQPAPSDNGSQVEDIGF